MTDRQIARLLWAEVVTFHALAWGLYLADQAGWLR